MKRREFVQTTSFAAVGLLSLPSFLAAAKAQKGIGLQLYSLRDTIDKDPKGVLHKVASYGYNSLETYGYSDGKIFGLDFTEFCKYAKGLGMKITSGHYDLDIARGGGWKKAVEDARKNGQEFMVVPYVNEPERKSIDNYKKICVALNAAGEVCNQNGIRLGYHNHAFEFDMVDGQIPYDVMLKELDPKKVSMEMDIFWVVNAGNDPVRYFKEYPGRFEQWHIKDMDKTDRFKNADVGTGSINFKELFAHAEAAGLKRWYVEQENYPVAPIDSVAASAKYLKTIL